MLDNLAISFVEKTAGGDLLPGELEAAEIHVIEGSPFEPELVQRVVRWKLNATHYMEACRPQRENKARTSPWRTLNLTLNLALTLNRLLNLTPTLSLSLFGAVLEKAEKE